MKTTVYTQDHADTLNERQGVTPAQVQAAVICSMFNCWQNFDKITKDHQDRADAHRATCNNADNYY